MSILDRCVVFACDFKPRSVNGLAVMPNHGRAGGAPTWLTLGDVGTANTLPIPLAGYGAQFTGAQYVDTGMVDRYERTDKFSLYFFGAAKSDALIASVDNALGYIAELDIITKAGMR